MNKTFNNKDAEYMKLCLELAKKAEGRTNPNPLVGCVIVKNGKIIATGYHKCYGSDHAEVVALKKAGKKAKNAFLYVNLEPCNHYGNTPPCTDAIIKHGIKKVIVGMRDPNPINNGRGIKKLIKHNIKIKCGIMEKESNELNRVFIKYITTGMPYVTCKIAQSIDGKIATKYGESKWITSSFSRKYVHKMRGKVDAILVGINTILKDNPLLTARNGLNNKKNIQTKQPVKIVLDSNFKIPFSANIFSKNSSNLNIIATTRNLNELNIPKKCNIIAIKTKKKNGKIDIEDLLKRLGSFKISHIMVEGGSLVTASFIKHKLVDEFLFFIAPKIIGGEKTASVACGVDRLKDAIKLSEIKLEKAGEDFIIKGRPDYVYRVS